MKQLFVFLVFLSLFNQSIAQGNARLFEDYTNCYTGVMSANGDTLWPAQFEQMHAFMFNDYLSDYCWIGKYKGYFGALDRMGKIVVPFEFENLSRGALNQEFIFTKNDKMGVVSRSGEIVIDGIYDEIVLDGYFEHNFYHVYKDGLVGLINSKHQIMFEPRYRYIDYVRNPNEEIVGPSKYLIANDSLNALLIDTLGKVLIEGQYSTISPYPIRLSCDNWTYCFLAYTNTNKTFIFDSQGRKLTDKSYEDIDLQTVIYNFCDSIGSYAICKTEKGKELINLATGEHSKNYPDLKFFSSHHLFADRKNEPLKKYHKPIYGVMNKEFEELPFRSKYPLAMFNENGIASLNATSYFSEITGYSRKIIFDSNIVALLEAQIDSRYEKKNKSGKSNFYGLLNYKTGKQIDPQFHQIFRMEFEGKSYFWAMRFNSFDNNAGELTIFSSDLDELFQGTVLNWDEYTQINYQRCTEKKERMFIIQNGVKRFGGLNSKGEIVMPFEFTQVDARRIEQEDRSCPWYNWIVTKEGKSGVYNWKGEQILPAEYDEVRIDELGYIQLRKDSLWKLLDLNFNEKISNCSMIIPSIKSAMRVQRVKPTYQGSFLDGRMFFAIKDGYLYYEEDGLFKKVDSTVIFFNLPLMVLNTNLLIRKDGSVVDVGESVASVQNSLFVVHRKNDYYLYSSGTVKGIKAGELVNHVEGVRTFSTNHNQLLIQLKNQRWGAYNYTTGKTLVEPKYWEIFPAINAVKSKDESYWVALSRDQRYVNSDWMLINGKGESLFSKVVDIPFNLNRSNLAYFCIDKKFGIVDSSMSILVPAIYDLMIEKDSIFFLKKDGRWFGFRRETGIVDLNAEHISIDPYRNGYLLFGYQGIAIVDKRFNFVLPYTNVETAVNTLDLMKLLGNSIMMKTAFHPTTYYINESRSVGRIINNRHLLELAETRSTRYSLANQNHYLTRLFDNGNYRINELRELDIHVVYYKKNYMSVKRIKKSTPWRNFVENSYSTGGIVKMTTEYATYKLTDTSYTSIELKDLFVGKANYLQLIDDLLTAKINKRQLFGANCVNLAGILSDYRKNFYLSDEGIVFCQPGNTYQNIVLTYKELGMNMLD